MESLSNRSKLMSQDEDRMLDEIQRMQEHVDRLFNDVMPSVRWVRMGKRKTWRPPTDVYETDDAVIVKVEIAGMSEEDFAISLSNRSLSITGARRDPDYKLAYQQLEIPYGHFCTEVFLPQSIALDEVSARYENGFLTVTLPKVQARRIQVTEKAEQDRDK
jgi:HSP20 family protein